jgi:hypothetical protein
LFWELLGVTLDNGPPWSGAIKEAVSSRDAVSGKLDKYGQGCIVDFDLRARRNSHPSVGLDYSH